MFWKCFEFGLKNMAWNWVCQCGTEAAVCKLARKALLLALSMQRVPFSLAAKNQPIIALAGRLWRNRAGFKPIASYA